MRRRIALTAMAALLVTACGPQVPRNTGVYLLLDTSGTYREELKGAQRVIHFLLTKLGPKDSIAVARIDTGSFSEKDIVAKATFDERPSTANLQKRAFAKRVGNFVQASARAPYTDITGGILQAVEFLNEKGTGRKQILIYSDLQEDLQKGYIRDVPMNLKGFEVVALNVTKLRSDNLDPREYMARVDAWKQRIEKSGGTWRVVNDLDRLDGL